MADTVEADTTVDESYTVTVPACIREEANLEAGDGLRWRVTEAGDLEVEVLKRRYGAFSDLEPVDIDEGSNAAEDDDLVAGDF